MRLKRTFSLIIGIIGFLMVLNSLVKGAITGAVIGTNITSKVIGVFGVIFMIIAIFVERYESDKKK